MVQLPVGRLFKRKGDQRWRVRFKNASGRWTERVGTHSEHETKAYMAELLAEVQDNKRANCPIQDCIEDYLAHIEMSSRSEEYLQSLRYYLEEVTQFCGFKTVGDLDPDRIRRVLIDLQADRTRGTGKTGKKAGRSAIACNHRIRAIKSLELYLLNRGRIAIKRLGVLKQFANTESVHPRRALSPDEQATLLESTGKSTRSIMHHTGSERRFLYLIALTTGLWAGELARLKKSDFHRADTDGALYVKARASVTKNKQVAYIPIRDDVVPELVARLESMDDDQRLFPGSWRWKASRMIYADLTDAGIEPVDDRGYADFHSLHASFVATIKTRLMRMCEL